MNGVTVHQSISRGIEMIQKPKDCDKHVYRGDYKVNMIKIGHQCVKKIHNAITGVIPFRWNLRIQQAVEEIEWAV